MDFYVGVGHDHTVQDLLVLARHAESVGFAGFTLGDHLSMAVAPKTPYPDGRPRFAVDAPWPDVWVFAAAMGALTTRLRFLSTVFLLPLRHPLLVAKATATAALVAGGRIELGVGVGWQQDEFEVLGEDFRTRGARTDEAIEVLRKLWAPGPTEHSGRFFQIPALFSEPTPEEPLPVYVGGSSAAAYERAARLGDGYISMPSSPEDLRRLVPELRDRVRDHGRPPERFRILANGRDARTCEDYAEMADLGADVALVRPVNMGGPRGVAATRRALDEFAARVVEPLARPRGS